MFNQIWKLCSPPFLCHLLLGAAIAVAVAEKQFFVSLFSLRGSERWNFNYRTRALAASTVVVVDAACFHQFNYDLTFCFGLSVLSARSPKERVHLRVLVSMARAVVPTCHQLARFFNILFCGEQMKTLVACEVCARDPHPVLSASLLACE